MNMPNTIRLFKKFTLLSKEIGINEAFYFSYQKKMNPSKYNERLIRQLKEEFKDILVKYDNQNFPYDTEIDNEEKRIWVFWWQGTEAMPEIVNQCVSSILKYNNGHKVTILTQHNYANYLDIPKYIIDKFEKGYISVTHFSDILRIGLLKKWGGAWIDSTILLTNNLDDIIFETPFYSRKYSKGSKFISNGKWSSYFLAGHANNIIFSCVYDMLCKYWEKYNLLLDYLLIDYIFELCYREISQIKEIINAVPENNIRIHELSAHINDQFDTVLWQDICTSTTLHKLSWKGNYLIYNKKGEVTFFGHIMKN